ncbi:hypothetical protein Tco_1377906 [Tanacetum coccineum]
MQKCLIRDALIGNEVFAKNDMIKKDQDVIPKEVSTAAPSTNAVLPPVITKVEITLAQISLGAQEDASKQGRSRIEAIDRDVEVTLVETRRGNDENDDNLIFDTGVFYGDEIVVVTEEPVINTATTTKSIPSAKPKEKDVVQESSENVSTATTMVSTATTTVVVTPAITILPQQRAKGIAFKKPVESTVTTTVPSQKSKDKGNAIMIEPKKPLKKMDQIELDEELAREIEVEEQAELERIQKERVAQEEASIAAIYEE